MARTQKAPPSVRFIAGLTLLTGFTLGLLMGSLLALPHQSASRVPRNDPLLPRANRSYTSATIASGTKCACSESTSPRPLMILREALPDNELNPPASPLPSARILSMNHSRYTWTENVLRSIGLVDIARIHPFSVNSSMVSSRYERFTARFPERAKYAKKFQGFLSNLVSFGNAWNEFARERGNLNDWRVFVEDDVAVNPRIKPDQVLPVILKSLELAQRDGLVFFAICLHRFTETTVLLVNNIELRKGRGRCSQTYAMTRWKALGLWAQLESNAVAKKKGFEYIAVTDVRLDVYGMTFPYWIAGSNLPCFHTRKNETGLFCQDEVHFPSIIEAT